jgi:hypothetical protein
VLCCAGAATGDIISHYVSTIRTLRCVDPAGVLLEAVSEPIRDYLRGRKVNVTDRHSFPCCSGLYGMVARRMHATLDLGHQG